MTVWVVWEGNWKGASIFGVYSTEQAAQAAATVDKPWSRWIEPLEIDKDAW